MFASRPVNNVQDRDADPAPVRYTLFLLGRDGRLGDRIGVFDGEYRPSGAVSDAFVVAADDSVLYADNGSTAEIKAYTRNGQATRIVRWRDPLTPVTPQLIEELNDARTPTNATPGQRAASLARFRSIKHRPFAPAYTNFFVDRAGRLWVRDNWLTARDGKYNPGYTVSRATVSCLADMNCRTGITTRLR